MESSSSVKLHSGLETLDFGLRMIHLLGMPIYEYLCQECGKEHEVIQKISDPPLLTCPSCGGKVDKKMSISSFQLKGGGWYSEGYASKKPEKRGEKGDKTDEKPKKEGGKNGKAAEKGPKETFKAPAVGGKKNTEN